MRRKKTPQARPVLPPAKPSVARQLLSPSEASLTHEIEYIISKAQEHDSRVVRFGGLILFSTETGDAWILDIEDGLALCLAREGDREDFYIAETEKRFEIEWKAEYKIEGDLFIVVSKDGRIRSIFGYPVQQIMNLVKE
ncbi:MAG: hypothetical protein NTX50_24770 [Candidatus Sumerlaeota bacterium]|nr:hypothetical protein [Candidatus Sumerlaeota bacterium]